MRYDLYSPAKKITAHILLPKGRGCAGAFVDGQKTEYVITKVGESEYVDFELTDIKVERVSIQIDIE